MKMARVSNKRTELGLWFKIDERIKDWKADENEGNLIVEWPDQRRETGV